MTALKRALVAVLTSTPLRPVFRPWTRRTVPVVMLHRFAPDEHPGRTSAAGLDDALRAVHEHGLRTITLGDLALDLERGRLPERRICFTVDDGYRDFAEHAHPVFARHGAKVTVFPIAGFLDGGRWNWWDRIHACFRLHPSPRPPLLDALGRPLGSDLDARTAAESMVASCKEVPDSRRRETLETLERTLGVDLPAAPPDDCAPMRWEDVTRLAREGVEFGGHTVTHPILSRVTPERQREELSRSLAAVERATGCKPSVFAYPNGRARDFDDRCVAALREFGVRAAVTTEPGVVSRAVAARRDGLLRLPRLPFPDRAVGRRALVCGLEAAKISLGRR